MADVADDDPRLLRMRRWGGADTTATPPTTTTAPATTTQPTDMPTIVVTAPKPSDGSSSDVDARLARIQKFQPGLQPPPATDTTQTNTTATGDTIAPNLRAAITPDPNATYAGVLPLKRDASGIHLAIPGGAYDFANGMLDLLEGPITGTVTPQGTNALLSAALAGAKGGPPGFKPAQTSFLPPEFRDKPVSEDYSQSWLPGTPPGSPLSDYQMKTWRAYNVENPDAKTATLIPRPPITQISREDAESLWRLHNPGKDVPSKLLFGDQGFDTRGSWIQTNKEQPPLYVFIDPKTGVERYGTRVTPEAPNIRPYTEKPEPGPPPLQSDVAKAASHLGGAAVGAGIGMAAGPIGAGLGGLFGWGAGELSRALISKYGPQVAGAIMSRIGSMGPNGLWLTEPQNNITDMPQNQPIVGPLGVRPWQQPPAPPAPPAPPSTRAPITGNNLLLPQYRPEA